MIIPFSERHKKLVANEKFKVDFNPTQRRKIIYQLEEYNETFHETTETNWNYTETSLEKVHKDLLRAYGLEHLTTDSEEPTHKKIREFLMNGKGISVLDAIELFFQHIIEDKRKIHFTSELNKLFKVEAIPVRFMEGEFFRLDSEFLESEVLFQTTKLLSTNNFETAHADFLDARQRLSAGDYSGAIISANNSLESYLKKLFNLKNENQGKLKKALIKSGLIPDYFNGFLDHFDGFVQSAFTIANKSARHGKMDKLKEKNQVDEPIAAFCLNLIGTIILFIMDRHIKSQPTKLESKSEEVSSIKIETNNDELPF